MYSVWREHTWEARDGRWTISVDAKICSHDASTPHCCSTAQPAKYGMRTRVPPSSCTAFQRRFPRSLRKFSRHRSLCASPRTSFDHRKHVSGRHDLSDFFRTALFRSKKNLRGSLSFTCGLTNTAIDTSNTR